MSCNYISPVQNTALCGHFCTCRKSFCCWLRNVSCKYTLANSASWKDCIGLFIPIWMTVNQCQNLVLSFWSLISFSNCCTMLTCVWTTQWHQDSNIQTKCSDFIQKNYFFAPSVLFPSILTSCLLFCCGLHSFCRPNHPPPTREPSRRYFEYSFYL